MKYFLKFIILFCATQPLKATEISPWFGIGNDSFAFSVESLGGQSKTIQYEPNIPGLSRLGLNAYGFGASVSFRADVKDLDTQKGQSEFSDFQLGYHNTKWGLDLFYQEYKGFYISNTAAIGGSTNTYYTFPDLQFRHYALMGRWAFDNQGFSISNLMNQPEQIKKTAGSYFIIAGVRHHTLESDSSSIIPTQYNGINTDMDDLRSVRTHSVNLGLGAGKYWVSDSHFFIGAVFDLLGTYGLYSYKLVSSEFSSSYATISFNLKPGLGYSGENFRTGVSVSQEMTTLKGLNSSFIKPTANQVLIYLRAAF